MHRPLLFFLPLFLILVSCQGSTQKVQSGSETERSASTLFTKVADTAPASTGDPSVAMASLETTTQPAPSWSPGDFDRSTIKERLATKRKNGEAWIAHVLVPLCDNDNQGIVPVNSTLGNGQNPRTNLYWGAGYGLRTHFKRSADWMTIDIEAASEKHILDQVAFEKSFPGGNKVILIMQAYDGAYMKTCLEDYFDYLAGGKACSVTGTDGTRIKVGKDADLIAVNGHNGLMDVDVAIPASEDQIHKDAVAIACISHDYFREPLAQTGGYPLLCTTGLMAPEAYVIRAVLDAWGSGKSPAEIRTAAGAAYHKYQKCGLKGATNLFRTGW